MTSDFTNVLALVGIPILAALIGWITNVVAIKMLFHPKKPIHLGFMTLHGVFPKRQQQFAERLGELVSGELLSGKDIHERLQLLASKPEFHDELADKLKILLATKLPVAVPMLAMFVNEEMVKSILAQIRPDLSAMLSSLVDSLAGNLDKTLDIKKLVEAKVQAFSSERLESVILGIMKREFREVELLGGVLGFLIGLLQVGLQQLSN